MYIGKFCISNLKQEKDKPVKPIAEMFYKVFGKSIYIVIIAIIGIIGCKSSTESDFSSGTTGGSTNSSSSETLSAYTLNGGTAVLSNKTFSTSLASTSGVLVKNSGNLTLTNCKVTTSGNTSSADSSSFYGIDAGVLATSSSTVVLNNCYVYTTGTGANGVFSTGSGTKITLTSDTIVCTGQLGHGVDATLTGTMVLTDCVIKTGPGANSAAIATDRGGGTITVTGGSFSTTGNDAPGVYSTGTITVTNAAISAANSELVVIEGTNSVTLNNCTVTSAAGGMSDKWGNLIYQSMSGDASGQSGEITVTGGSLTYTAATGPLFFVTNTSAKITLSGVSIPAVTSGVFLKASVYSRWSSTTGGTVTLIATGQIIKGDITADSYSSITATFSTSSSLTGAINNANTAKSVSITMDGTSTWILTGDSYITSLSDTNGISGTAVSNITGNGYTIYYNASSCTALGGLTYTLSGGGYLKPAS